jgi:nucleoside-diphosphate-sugar epimerase
MIIQRMGLETSIEFLPEMPTGPYNRVASNQLAKELLGWEPKVPFRDGIAMTIDWYVKNRDQEQIKSSLESMLTAR